MPIETFSSISPRFCGDWGRRIRYDQHVKRFLDDDFLLDSPTAERLFHEHAKSQPIIDYHCHLPPEQVADNHRFRSLTEIWLDGDHYKWRALRADGVDERLITGDATDAEKFAAWARTVPRTLRNPLYHWTHMELKFPFGVRDRLLGPDTAADIYEHCNALLATDAFTTQGLMRQYDVRVVCSTDDPVDDLAAHARHAKNLKATTKLLPTWRPDKALGIQEPGSWNAWVDRLGEAANIDVRSYGTLLDALARRHDVFHAQGCRLSDHGLDTLFATPYVAGEVEAAVTAARSGVGLDPDAVVKFRSALLYDLALLDHKRGWAQQFHLGALRNNNTRMMRTVGPDSGFDSIGDWPQAATLARFLDRLDSTDQLARTIVYNLNPADNEVFATVLGNFQGGGIPGKMQFGSAWWFLDQQDGMTRQLSALSSMGLLSRFVGMLTDSRSFLSYSRHDYFRRLLCNLLGQDIERGLIPNDLGLVGGLVKDICFNNARTYFGFEGI